MVNSYALLCKMHSNDCSTKNRCDHIVTQSVPFLILHHSTSLENLRRWLRICTRDRAMHWPKETTAIEIVFFFLGLPSARGCSKTRYVNPEPRTRRLRWHSSMNAERRRLGFLGDISLTKMRFGQKTTKEFQHAHDIMLQEALAMRDAARENLRRQDCACFVFAFGYCTDNID